MRPTQWWLHNETRGIVLAERVFAADNFFSRLRGLIGYRPLEPGTALWIEPCQQVHTHFMRRPLQVLFVDREMQVVRVIHELGPWRMSPWVRSARAAVELAAGRASQVAEGERLAVRRTEPKPDSATATRRDLA
jgi:uncharacterized membrane protein (UPF0127 family)